MFTFVVQPDIRKKTDIAFFFVFLRTSSYLPRLFLSLSLSLPLPPPFVLPSSSSHPLSSRAWGRNIARFLGKRHKCCRRPLVGRFITKKSVLIATACLFGVQYVRLSHSSSSPSSHHHHPIPLQLVPQGLVSHSQTHSLASEVATDTISASALPSLFPSPPPFCFTPLPSPLPGQNPLSSVVYRFPLLPFYAIIYHT